MLRFALCVALCFLVHSAPAQTAASPANSLTKYRSAPPPLVLTFRSGYVANPSGTKIVFAKLSAGMTVASIEASADDFECAQLAVVTLYDCGTSHACTGAKAVGSVMISAANNLFQSAAKGQIGMGDYYAWAIAGKCSGVDVTATARAAH